jgi:hypothetical protein
MESEFQNKWNLLMAVDEILLPAFSRIKINN